MPLNPFSNVQISVLGLTATIQYKVDPNFKGQTPYTFYVEAFEDNTFTEPLYSLESTTYYVIDNSNYRQNAGPSYLYRVKLITNDNKTYYSSFIGWHPDNHVTQHNYLIASEIVRKEHLRFNYVGMYCYLFKRKLYGPVANQEVNPITGEPYIDVSSGSYGTGMVGGYYPPCLFRFSIEAREVKDNFEESGNGVKHTEIIKTRAVGFPYIDQHDIIVTCDDKRYIVIDSGNKYFPGTTMILLQTPTLQLIPVTDTIYSLPVPQFPNE